MRTIKMSSHYQAIWRANQKAKKGENFKWKWLEEEQVEEIRYLRKKGNTYRNIAELFKISISAVAKHCKDIEVCFTDFDCKLGRSGRKKKTK